VFDRPPEPGRGRRGWFLIAAALAVTGLAVSSFTAGRLAERPNLPQGFDAVISAANELHARAAHPVTDQELAQAAIRGMLDALGDPYATLLDPGQTRSIDDLISGTFVGIGIWISTSKGGSVVSAVIRNTPASRAGLKAGDLLVKVNGRSVHGLALPSVSSLLHGPEGTTVSLEVRRGSSLLRVSLRRQSLPLPLVDSRMLAHRIGYVRLFQFARGAGDQVRARTKALLDRGAIGIVFDLRGDPGGLVDEAYRTVGVFIDHGVITTIRQRGEPDHKVYAQGDALATFPMAVLVDGGTASASEITSGALQDDRRAVLVGTRTFGKGSVLNVESLPGTAQDITFTTAFFYTPNGHQVEGIGITPDFAVAAGPKDPQLARAVRAVLDQQ
jgi:carboxyl-terminal processing protease